MAKRTNKPDLTTRNLHAQDKVDFKQDVRLQGVKRADKKRDAEQAEQIESLAKIVETLTSAVENLTTSVERLTQRFDKLEREVNNPLGLQS